MPSFDYPEVQDQNEVINTVAVTDKEFKHSIVDTKVEPLNSLITHVEGSSRIVDYYSQILSRNEQPQKYSADLAPQLQQYRLIKDMEIKQSAFDFSFDEIYNEATGTGTAIVYPPLIPNFQDMFIADIGNGMIGMMVVTSVEKKSIFKQACYEINFMLERIINNQGEVDVINQKVVETYYFVKDFLLYGQNPLLVSSEFNLLKDSNRIMAEGIDDYLNEFYSRELTCLTVPGHGVPTYDPFAVKAFMEIVEVSTLRKAMKMNVRNTDELKEFWDNSIWAALINPSQHQYRSLWKRARPVPITSFNVHPRINSIRFSGYDKCVKPLDKLENVDSYYKLNERGNQGYYGYFTPQVNPITASGSAIGYIEQKGNACWCMVQNYYHSHHLTMHPWDPMNHLSNIAQYQHTCHDPDCPCACHNPVIDPDTVDATNSYIFSPSFYDDSISSQDGFEQLVKAHLSMQTIDPAVVNALLLQRATWTPQQRYYKMLILVIIQIAAVRSM